MTPIGYKVLCQFNIANCIIIVRTVEEFFVIDLYELGKTDQLLKGK